MPLNALFYIKNMILILLHAFNPHVLGAGDSNVTEHLNTSEPLSWGIKRVKLLLKQSPGIF